jgi:hypothetical protein
MLGKIKKIRVNLSKNILKFWLCHYNILHKNMGKMLTPPLGKRRPHTSMKLMKPIGYARARLEDFGINA